MDEKGLTQYPSNTLRTNKQKTLDITASIDELKKKEHEPEYVFLYWDEW